MGSQKIIHPAEDNEATLAEKAGVVDEEKILEKQDAQREEEFEKEEKTEIMMETSSRDREKAIEILAIPTEEGQAVELAAMEEEDGKLGTNRAELVKKEIKKILESNKSARIKEEGIISQDKKGELGE